MGDFHRYYSGEKQAPVLTLVIGGNHEASNYLSELYHGGWLAPNIYYLGATNVLRYGPLRIAGISGIYNHADYRRPHHERLPYDKNEIHSIYHVRECDIFKLLQIRFPIDIGISHDWPRRVEWFGDYESLFAEKPPFFESVKTDGLGSPPAEQVMNHLRPQYWFSGHMHIKYSAKVRHDDTPDGDIFKGLKIPDTIRAQLPNSMFRAAFQTKKSKPRSSPPDITNTVTRFLALDKPVPDRGYLKLLEIDSCSMVVDVSTKNYIQRTSENKFRLHYDEEWLSIIRSLSDTLDNENTSFDTGCGEVEAAPTGTTSHHLKWVQKNVTAKGLLKIPRNFKKHAPTHDQDEEAEVDEQPTDFPNSMTEEFCKMLQIRHKFSVYDKTTEYDDYIVFE